MPTSTPGSMPATHRPVVDAATRRRLVARTPSRPRGPRALGLLIVGAMALGCSSEEAGTVPPPAPDAAVAPAPDGSALSAQDVARKRFDETPPPRAPRKR